MCPSALKGLLHDPRVFFSSHYMVNRSLNILLMSFYMVSMLSYIVFRSFCIYSASSLFITRPVLLSTGRLALSACLLRGMQVLFVFFRYSYMVKSLCCKMMSIYMLHCLFFRSNLLETGQLTST